jgi:predicted metal-dependent phosphoesterase TrpH
MRFDLHIHSKHSPDSFLKPEKIVKAAKKRGLDGVAVTDHNTIKGSLEALKINKDPDFEVIVGSEIKTEYGDVLGLFLNEEIKTHSFDNVIDEIRSQGGISVLAHPYRQYNAPEEIVAKVDLVEGFNARSKSFHNDKSLKLADTFNKPMTAGSDTHLYFEVGKGTVSVEENIENALKKGNTKIEGNESSYYLVHGCSVLIEKIKLI